MKSKFSNRKKQTIAWFAMLTLAACPAYAATPNTGTALENVKPPAIQQPVSKAPDVTIEGQASAAQNGDEQKIAVSGFKISGEPPLPANELQKIVQSEAGRELTLAELNRLAGEITQYLRQKGYLVAFAYIPPQDIKDGNVEIAVIPGKYGQVKITGTAHIAPGLLQGMLSVAKPGQIITREPLERALLLISDLNGISVKATLTPGPTTGTADLILEAADTAKISGAMYADNWGNRYTGKGRYGVQLNINNPGSIGDILTLGGLTTGEGIDNYNIAYSLPLGRDGARFEIKRSGVYYTLGDTFASLDATGRALVTSCDISYPFIRNRSFSLYGSIGFDNKHLHDDTIARHSPKTSNLWNAGLSGNFTDNWNGGSTNVFSLTYYRGDLDINDAADSAIDASTLHTAGSFNKTVLTYQRRQYVAHNLDFNFNFIGQLAGKNLDSSEKLYLGGADGVRAYPQGEAAGDQGCRFTGELRLRMPDFSQGSSNVYLTGFYDYGNVETDKHPVAGADDNSHTLRGAGLGLLWTHAPDFVCRLDYAWKIGHEEAAADTDKSGRLWLQGIVYF